MLLRNLRKEITLNGRSLLFQCKYFWKTIRMQSLSWVTRRIFIWMGMLIDRIYGTGPLRIPYYARKASTFRACNGLIGNYPIRHHWSLFLREREWFNCYSECQTLLPHVEQFLASRIGQIAIGFGKYFFLTGWCHCTHCSCVHATGSRHVPRKFNFTLWRHPMAPEIAWLEHL